MPEEVKRLPPKPSTLRSLYLMSGNLCAYPGCKSVLINTKGTMVGDICHIRAAEKKGPRFDKSMTNETRRAGANLLLMCVVHHRKIDREAKTYTVEKLERIKREHEKRFSEVKDTLTRRFEEQYQDETDSLEPTLPTTFGRFNASTKAGLESEQIDEAARQIAKYVRKLGLLPEDDRKLLSALVRRARKVGRRVLGDTSASVHADEFAKTHGASKARINRFGQTLERHGLGNLYEVDPGVHNVGLNDPSHYVGWMDIGKFCEKMDLELDEIAVQLRFGLLD